MVREDGNRPSPLRAVDRSTRRLIRPKSRWIPPRITADIHPDDSLESHPFPTLQEEWIELQEGLQGRGLPLRSLRKTREGIIPPRPMTSGLSTPKPAYRSSSVKSFCPECHRVRHLNEEIRDDFELPASKNSFHGLRSSMAGPARDAERHLRDCDDKRAALLGRKWTVSASAILDYFETSPQNPGERLGLPKHPKHGGDDIPDGRHCHASQS